MSGMLAVSKPPMICTEGLRSSQASVIGKNVCHEANQPKTRSAAQHGGHDLEEVGHPAGLVEVLDLVLARRGSRGRWPRSSPCGCARRAPACASRDRLRRNGLLDEGAVPLRELEQAVEDALVVRPAGAVGGHEPRDGAGIDQLGERRARARSGARPPPPATRAASRRRAWRSRASGGWRSPAGTSRAIARRCSALAVRGGARARARGSAPRSASARRRGTGTRCSRLADIDILSAQISRPSGRKRRVSR